MNRAIRWIRIHGTAIAIASLLAWGVWLPLTAGVPITIEGHVETAEIEAGGELRVHFQITRHEVCQTTAYASIFGADLIERRFPPTSQPAFGPLGNDEKIVSYTLPANLPPGPSRYRMIFNFECNWVQRLKPAVLVMPDIAFTVIEPTPTPAVTTVVNPPP